MTIRPSFFANKRDNLPYHHEFESFGAFLEELAKSREFREDKDGLLFCPAEFDPERRLQKNVVAVHFGVLDLDDIWPHELDEVQELLAPYHHALYTTWSHSEALATGRHRYRALIELSRPVTLDEWPDFWPRMVTRFSASRDESCKDASRIYYTPSAPIGTEAQAVFLVRQGEPLDVDEVLADPDPGIPMPRHRRSLPSPVRPEHRRIHATAQAKEWGAKRLREHCAEVAKVNDATDQMYPVLNRAAFLAGQLCPHLLDPEETALALLDAALAQNPGRSKKYIPIIEKGMADGQADPWWPEPRYPLTDTGNAERIVDLYGSRIRYVEAWKKWLVWDGTRWEMDSAQAHVQELVKESIRSIRTEAERVNHPAHKKRMLAWAHQSESVTRRRAAEALAAVETGITISHVVLDADPWLLNTPTGTLDLRTGQLNDHEQGDLITKISPVAYRPDASAPTWERFLLDCMDGNEEMVAYLQRAVGYSLTGSVVEQCLFFLYGNGANGKSTFVKTILKILGSYGVTGAPDLLLAKSSQAHPTEQTDLAGARFVACQEIEQNRSWAESTVKQLTGGDAIKARRMREDFWTFDPTHKFWISGNHKPNVRGTDRGIWRRIRLIPFVVSFEGREDRSLDQKLEAELEGILAWAVRGALAWRERGLDTPGAVVEATEKYRSEQDSIGNFLADACILDPNARVTRSQLRRAYDLWCQEEGERYPLSARAFAAALRERGIEEVSSVRAPGKAHPERGWRGVGLVAGTGTMAGLRAVGP